MKKERKGNFSNKSILFVTTLPYQNTGYCGLHSLALETLQNRNEVSGEDGEHGNIFLSMRKGKSSKLSRCRQFLLDSKRACFASWWERKKNV